MLKPHTTLSSLAVLILAASGAVFAAPTASVRPLAGQGTVLGSSALVNGDFEEWSSGAKGWKVEATGGECSDDGAVVLHGSRSLRLHIPKGPASVVVTSEPVPVAAGRSYYVRFGCRAAGLSATQSYAGGQMEMHLIWKNEPGSFYRIEYVDWSYFPMAWGYRDRFCKAPTGATQVCAVVALTGDQNLNAASTAWFDDLAICPYDAPPTVDKVEKQWSVTAGKDLLSAPGATAWFYPAGTEGDETAQAARVRDRDAILGSALHSARQVTAGYVYLSPYTLEQPPGLYRAYFRMKIPESSSLPPDKRVAELDIISSDSGLRGSLSLTHASFDKPGRYQDISFDFTKRTRGWLAIRVYTDGGNAEYWLDHIRIVQLRPFRDNDLLAWYPGTGGLMGPNPSLEREAGKTRVLLANGLLADRFHLDKALSTVARCSITRLDYRVGQEGAIIDGFPMQWTDMRRYGVVILANVDPGALGPEQRLQLAQYVRLGGGLMLLGGKAAFRPESITGSFIDEVLPIGFQASATEIASVSAPARAKSARFGPLPAPLAVPYLHRVQLRPGAEEILDAGGMPVLVTGRAGQGRIACFMGAPYGTDAKGARHFANSDQWPGYLAGVIRWLAGGE